jgi:hypothetical protein
MYLRFVVGGDDEHHKLLSGLITEARLLRDKGALTSHEAEHLESLYEWFNNNLPCPPFETAGWSRDAVSWFKDTAKEPIKKMRELSIILDSHGLLVRTLRSERPGRVLYEDEYQIVVIENKSL